MNICLYFGVVPTVEDEGRLKNIFFRSPRFKQQFYKRICWIFWAFFQNEFCRISFGSCFGNQISHFSLEVTSELYFQFWMKNLRFQYWTKLTHFQFWRKNLHFQFWRKNLHFQSSGWRTSLSEFGTKNFTFRVPDEELHCQNSGRRRTSVSEFWMKKNFSSSSELRERVFAWCCCSELRDQSAL